jgi:hypothetical protein
MKSGWLQMVARSGRIILVSLRALLLRTDVQRWRRAATEAPPWDERNKLIAELIPNNQSVLDLGSGAQTLRKYLKPGCRYQPCDLVNSSSDVLLCDFNADIYPQVQGEYDYVVCSGVFEYMRAPREFLTRVALLGKQVILSYAVARSGETRWQRLREGWINTYTQPQLEELFASVGLRWQRTTAWGRQVIYTIWRET